MITMVNYCRLCGCEITDNNKCDAHIIPRGILKIFSPEEFGKLSLVGTDMSKRKAPQGSYDNSILCRGCDNKIGVYDDYAGIFVRNAQLTGHPSGTGWQIEGYDQNKLKLFFMSYLWRSSITERSEFAGVNLGAKHENRLQQLILSNLAGSVDEYTVVLSKFRSAKDQVGGILIAAKSRMNGLVYYQGDLPRMYKFRIKVDRQLDPVMKAIGLGATDTIYVHDQGDFDASAEKKIMVRAVNYKGKSPKR